ncbi:hypothetical protein PO883_24595, partial [Massilia sp. DJPM01]|uniref:hypothetical protein n=1 Tax=Massilia sp. DJPM01 TaxID=3024404 RepID=UPI00259F92FD
CIPDDDSSSERQIDMTPICLPSIPELRAAAQSLAMLDAVLCPEWQYRYFSFNRAWAPGMEMASMRNGSGDDWFVLFDSVGAALKGFAHELTDDKTFSAKLQVQVPCEFSAFLSEPAFSMQDATFCYWRKADDSAWNKVHGTFQDDGSADLLSLLVGGPSGYQAWAESYYEIPVDHQAVSTVFGHAPLSDAIILALNPDAEVDVTYRDAAEIGYPLGTDRTLG